MVALVGVANVALGVLALATDRLRLDDPTSTALVVLGVLTLALGVLVAQGRRWAMVLAVVAFGGLFGIQAFGASGGAPAPAVITLALVLLLLVLALRATRRPDGPEGRPTDLV